MRVREEERGKSLTVTMAVRDPKGKELRIEIPAFAVFGDFAATERLRVDDETYSVLSREPDERECRILPSGRRSSVPEGHVRSATYAVTHVPTGLRAIDRIRTRKAAVEAAEACSKTGFDNSLRADPKRRDEWNAMVAAIVAVKRDLEARRATF
jgi:hypothetical protein